jgi:hypothetical protein
MTPSPGRGVVLNPRKGPRAWFVEFVSPDIRFDRFRRIDEFGEFGRCECENST